MRTIKFSIKVKAIDSYLYGGHLFIILQDGTLVYSELSKIIRKLVNAYPEFENLIRLSFQRNDFLHNKQGSLILGLPEVRNVLIRLWERASNEIEFVIDFDMEDYKVIGEVPSLPVLDMKLYAMRMYLGCKEGLYEIKLNPEDNYHLHPTKPQKRFDARVTYLNAKSGEVIVSANNDGLFHGSFLNPSDELKIIEKPAAKKSVRTGWSSYDVINYEQHDNFEYFVNETSKIEEKPSYSKFDESSERKRITNFGKSTYQLAKLLENSNIKIEDVSYCFNSSSSGFFFTKDGNLRTANLLKPTNQDFYFSSKSNIVSDTPNLAFKKPISSSIVPKGCVVEYFDKVVLYQNSKIKVIEEGPVISVRTYPSSIRYRNLISTTKDDEIKFHSIYPYDENPLKFLFSDLGEENDALPF